MAVLARTFRISKSIKNVTNLFANFSLSSNIHNKASLLHNFQRIGTNSTASFHGTARQWDLMEFFDDQKNWGKDEIKCGRSWKLDELRIKSNEDLHKLWFVLLKERNMLMTMEEACKQNWKIFPSPERLDKVADSMKNLETVVKERNQAYHLLETGETGLRPKRLVYDQIGMKKMYRMRQYVLPKFMNAKWHKTNKFGFGGYAVRKFLRLYREKLWNQKRKTRNAQKTRVLTYLRHFPNVDLAAIKEKYPDVDLKKALRSNRADGHFVPK